MQAKSSRENEGVAAGGCGAITVTDNSAGNSLDLTYSCLPPNSQAVVVATTTVSDIAGEPHFVGDDNHRHSLFSQL